MTALDLKAAAQRIGAETRAAQRLPERVEDVTALTKIAAVLQSADGAPRHNRAVTGVGTRVAEASARGPAPAGEKAS